MYAKSTHKRNWIWESPEALAEQRRVVNKRFVALLQTHLDERHVFPTSEEELVNHRLLCQRGIRFAKEFLPKLPPPVLWIAFTFFKRFYTKVSALQLATPPKTMLMVCIFHAAKVYDHELRMGTFVAHLKTIDEEDIRMLEPILMRELNYELVVHTPYKAFEGHLLEMKTRLPLLEFDLEELRPHAMEFFEKALISDAMLLYAPTHIAYAAVKYALEKCDKPVEILKDFLYRFLDLDEANCSEEDREQAQKVLSRVNTIFDMVLEQCVPIPDDDKTNSIECRIHDVYLLIDNIDERMGSDSPFQQYLKLDDSDSD
uniref:Cyclin_C_2 domain-containing protein n=1 Tax=Panagrellus redivivus TaxID=6233 RepID=A0A7E4VEA2_PANRE